MPHYVLIACASGKRGYPCRAADLYQSDLFRKSLQYAEALRPDSIFILSAKHGLLPPEEEIEPYDLTLNRMSAVDRRTWAERVLRKLAEVGDLEEDRFTFLAGSRYREHLLPRIRHGDVPMAGLTIGRQLKFLKDALAHE
jgi:hypothetical protein